MSQSFTHEGKLITQITPWKKKKQILFICCFGQGGGGVGGLGAMFCFPLCILCSVVCLRVYQIAFWDRRQEDKDKWDVLITVCGANVF